MNRHNPFTLREGIASEGVSLQMAKAAASDSMQTLPDLLAPNLLLVFVGLNPSEYSVREGHYFANPRNRFWPAFNRSGLLPASPWKGVRSLR